MFINLKNFFFCFVSYLLLFGTSLYAQAIYKKYDFVSIKEGVSKVGIYTIIQDDLGFVWLGTNGAGLYRYDGIGYNSYKYSVSDSSSLSSNVVYSSCLDSKNRLWFGTTDGLNLFNRETDKFTKIPNSEFQEESRKSIIIRCLKDDGKGNLFIGTMDLGLFKLSLDDLTIEKVFSQELVESNLISVKAIQIDDAGKIYVGTNIGVREYDPKTNSLKPSLFKVNGKNTQLSNNIESLVIDNEDNMWAGTVSSGLFKLSKTEKQSIKIEHLLISQNQILSLISLKDGTLLCGTENDGLFHLDISGKILHNYLSSKIDEESILSNSIWSLCADKNERIWVGHYNKGVSVYDKQFDKFKEIESLYHNSNSLNHESVSAIVEDDLDRLWIGMDGGGIDVFDKASNEFIHVNQNENYSGLTSNYIKALLVDSQGNLWVGTWDKGLYLLKKGTKKFINYTSGNTKGNLISNTILSIAEDAEGIIWIGTFNTGLLSYNPLTEKFIHYNSEPFLEYGIPETEIRKVFIDKDDNIWLGTSGCLFKIEKLDNNEFSVVSMKNKMSEGFNNHTSFNDILSLCQSEDSTLWIGTRGAGLCKYDVRQDIVTWYNKLNGLVEENVSNIIEDLNGNIWLAGNSGITKLEVASNTFTNFTNLDGLLSNDFNINSGCRDLKGNIYFGNFQGIDYFKPAQITLNTGLTSLHLRELKLFNKNVLPNQEGSPLKKVISETGSISLNSEQSVFTIEYLGLNYTRPEEVNYAYYLEGYEETWNYVGKKRNATYTNLDAGDYTFMLKASNNDGVWNESPLSLKITVSPPWWKTGWAIFSYLLLFLLGVFLLNKNTQARLKEKQLIENERTKRLQEIELRERKFQFFTNISHEFRTPLTLIVNPLIDIINDESLALPEKVKEKHRIIHKNADRLSRLINELLDFRKLELNKVGIKVRNIDLVKFCKEVINHFKEEAFTRNIDLSLDADISNLSVWADESMLEKIIFNLLSNAFKVTPDGGAIGIQLLMNDHLSKLPLVDESNPIEVVQIIISDTGPGIEKEEIKKIFERFYQVESLNKTYFGGTGIGLEVVQSFVELHKGKINVNSEIGKGTNFIIELPQGKKHFNENEIISNYTDVVTQKESDVLGGNSAKNRTERDVEVAKKSISDTLLIVEDNTELRNYLEKELASQYKILTAKNGKQGLQIAKESLPDIIITDVIMPEMDGFVFCENIKKDIRTSHIPLLMLTAKATLENKREGIETGADVYMVKPFDMDLLKLHLSQLVTSRQLIFNKYFSLISDLPSNVKTTSLDKEFIEKVLNYINANLDNPDLNVESLAAQLNLSRSQFYRKIKALTNQTATEFLRNIRLQKAKQIIEMGNSNINEVCYKVGFSSPSYFSKCFKSYFGVLPKDVKE